MLTRCPWAPDDDPLYAAYHDTEWGVPEYDARALWEKLILDGFQAGLAWITILRKRETMREAFDGFDPEIIARYGEADIERLLGNPGIISGVYDSREPSRIRWDRHVEFPFLEKGSFFTRPLGIAEANDALHFSEGPSIFRRIDGKRPRWEEILNLAEDTDTDVGGIRGLTAIPNPNGKGQSLLFVWAPGERSQSQVKRLDPDGKGGYTLHNEANLGQLMSRHLGVKIPYTLGGHNMMYPVPHPATGAPVQIIGFYGSMAGKPELRWKGSRFYGGALFALRTAAGKYTVHEVNGPYAPGKTLLVSPRAFCRSPFDPKEIFIGGHDSSNKISDNLAWIFRAPLSVALGVEKGEPAPTLPDRSPRMPRVDAGPVYELRIYAAAEDRLGRAGF